MRKGHRGLLGQWDYFERYQNSGDMSLYNCPNPSHYFTKLTLTISLPDGTARAILQMMELGFTERPKDRPQHRTSKWQSWDWLLTCLPFVRILTLIYMTIICFPFLNSFSPTPSSFSSVCSLHSLLPFPFLPSVPQAISKATTATARHLLESRSGDMRP